MNGSVVEYIIAIDLSFHVCWLFARRLKRRYQRNSVVPLFLIIYLSLS